MAKLPKSKATNAYDLLSEVRALILAEPKRYNQGIWLQRRIGGGRRFSEYFPSCGTVGCVAGWVTVLKVPSATDAQTTAECVLGLSTDDAFELFSSEPVGGTPQTRAHARNGAAHIRRFQRKYERQLKAKAV